MYRKNREEFAENTYKEKKVKVHEMISKHKREKWLECIKRQGKAHSLRFTSGKRLIELKKSKRRAKKSSLTVDGKIISDSKEQANIFAVNLEKKFSHEDKRHF